MTKPHPSGARPPKPAITVPYPTAVPDMPWNGAIERLAWGGHGVGRLEDGRILLLRAPLALFPGEEVTAAVQLKVRHGEGRVLDWTRADPRRVEPLCPHARRCGGCDLWGAGEHTAELKRLLVEDLLHRSLPGAPQWDWLPAPAEAKRQRIQLHWDGSSLGYHERDTNTIVAVGHCPLAVDAVSQAIPLLHAALAAGQLPAAPMRWELVTGTPPGMVLALQAPAGTPLANPAWAQWDLGSASTVPPVFGQGNPPLIEHSLPTGKLRHSASGFFQVCPSWAAQAFTSVYQQWRLGGRTLYDLYGGVGFHSALLARAVKQLVVVEADTQAGFYAGKNLSGTKHTVSSLTVERWLGDPANRAGIGEDDVLLLDPPRSGLPKSVTAALCGTGAQALVLCGCDGASFCRDVARLAPAWKLERLAVIDLFPNTVHVECVGLLRRETLT